jgi:hypothetical protein
MANPQVQHVIPKDDKWAVKAENSEQPSKIFDMKMNAVAYAFDITKKHEGGKIVIHRRDGTFKSVDVTEETSKLMMMLRS